MGDLFIMKSYQLTIPSNIYAGKSSIDNLVNIITKENVKSIFSIYR